VLRGYFDCFEVNPDSVVRARLSGINPNPTIRLLRVSHADPHPAGPGFLADEQPWPVSRVRPVTDQPTATGSLGIIDGCFTGHEQAATLVMWVLFTRLDEKAVIASWHTADGSLAVVADRGRLALESAHDGGDGGDTAQPVLTSPHDLRERVWYFVAAGFGADDGAVLAWGQAGRTGGPYLLAGQAGQPIRPRAGSPLVLGGRAQSRPAQSRPARSRGELDGKISAPCLIEGTADPIALMDIMNWGPSAGNRNREVLGQWVFGPPGDLDRIADGSGHDRHGRLVNAPSLGVTGPPGASPPGIDGHGTVHFHRDDLEDCGWQETHRFTVPADARSAIYVLRASDQQGRADLPFVVEPATNPSVLLLAPTFTWQAYGNLGRDPGRYPGRSHYALHGDGSPVYVTTRLKPIPTVEPGARLEVDGLDSFSGTEAASHDADVTPGETATHLLMADLYVNWWLEQTGVPYGVLTDSTLHARGHTALAGCRTLVLSAHPEYWTSSMLDALEAFIYGGGNVMYLGGNGLYWVTSVHPDRPHLLEVRRTGGSQTWSAEPGETRHAFDNVPGGTWRAQGRPPDALVGVGFAGFGWDAGLPYRRSETSREPEFAWVFEGTESDLIGAEGLNCGGAVAIEFDRYDDALAPPDCTVLASAYPEGGQFFRSYEDGIGRAPDPLVRCDMTIRTTLAGGIVFSLGAIAASGCLPVHAGRNDLARVCTNVLRRTTGAAVLPRRVEESFQDVPGQAGGGVVIAIAGDSA
jgi:N,N-dimethylformamidase